MTDDEATKQWCGVYTVEELHVINEQMRNMCPSLNDLYPCQLRPVKGICSTYFAVKIENLAAAADLQDNELCKSIGFYLDQAYAALGKNLFVDILFNDVRSDTYFEVYSDFNLSRISGQIDLIKSQLFPTAQTNSGLDSANKRNCPAKKKSTQTALTDLLDQQNKEHEEQTRQLTKQRLLNNVVHLINNYRNHEDKLIENMLALHAEYYKSLFKPLVESRELAKCNLCKYDKKLQGQLKTNTILAEHTEPEALDLLNKLVSTNKQEIYELSNRIDSLHIEYNQKIIELNRLIKKKMQSDKLKFVDENLNIDLTNLVALLTRSRLMKYKQVYYLNFHYFFYYNVLAKKNVLFLINKVILTAFRRFRVSTSLLVRIL